MVPIFKRLTVEEYLKWKSEFNFDGFRLGQAFLNAHYPTLACPELFYADNKSAEALIYENWLLVI